MTDDEKKVARWKARQDLYNWAERNSEHLSETEHDEAHKLAHRMLERDKAEGLAP